MVIVRVFWRKIPILILTLGKREEDILKRGSLYISRFFIVIFLCVATQKNNARGKEKRKEKKEKKEKILWNGTIRGAEMFPLNFVFVRDWHNTFKKSKTLNKKTIHTLWRMVGWFWGIFPPHFWKKSSPKFHTTGKQPSFTHPTTHYPYTIIYKNVLVKLSFCWLCGG